MVVYSPIDLPCHALACSHSVEHPCCFLGNVITHQLITSLLPLVPICVQVNNTAPAVLSCSLLPGLGKVVDSLTTRAAVIQINVSNPANDTLTLLGLNWEATMAAPALVPAVNMSAVGSGASAVYTYISEPFVYATPGNKSVVAVIDDGQEAGRSNITCGMFEVIPRACFECSQCLGIVSQFTSAQAAGTAASVMASDFLAFCTANATAITATAPTKFTATTCSTVASAIAASYKGNLARRPAALCMQLGSCAVRTWKPMHA